MENRRGYGDAIISSVLVIIVLGFFVTDYIGKYERQNYKNEFLNDTIIFSAGINPRRVSSLSWNTSDNYNPDYVRLRELLQLMDNHKNNIRWFYLMGLKNERIYFLVDSVNQNSPDHAEPGLEYSHPSQDFIAAFKNGKNVVTEPYTDEWGTFISALVPVRDFDTGKTLAVFGADINTSEFSHKIEMIKLYPIGITFLITMMLIGYFISKQRDEETKIVLENASNELLKFKLAVDNASNHIVITDTEGIVIYANPAVSTITGYSHNEIIGSKAGVLWGKLMDKKFYEMFWRTIKYEKKSFEGEVTNHRKNGETYDAHVNVSPVLNSNGKLTFFVGIERDITKEKNVDRMKTEFISLASHQLRTPLTAMKWYLEMLLNGDAGKLSTEQHDFINNVELSNNRMIELVNSLLNVSRIDSGKIAIEPVSTNLKELIDSSISDLRNKFKEKNIQLLINISSEITTIYVDQKLIRQVLINLLSNAAKYTPKDGIVSIQATKEGNNIILKVKDTGYGIPSKDKDKVFTKFYRGDNVVKLETEGNGLGLYLVKSIIVSSGGKIWFESIEGNGTTFWISLPISNTTGTVM